MLDVLVIGGGIAGVIAALSAHHRGARVLLVRRAFGATALSSGGIDVALDLPSLVECTDHPYATLRAELGRMEEALGFASRALGGLLVKGERGKLLLPTSWGTLKETDWAQRSQAGADLRTLPKRIAVVELWPNPSFGAEQVAAGLVAAASGWDLPLEAVPISCRFLRTLEEISASPHILARHLDADDEIARLADHLRHEVPKNVEAILLPPWMGASRTDVTERLSSLVGIPCWETLSGLPSVPGLRLQHALNRTLEAQGIPCAVGEVTGLTEEEGRFVTEWGMSRAVVLATGKLIGGGIRKGRTFQEPVFGLPVRGTGRWLEGEYVGGLLEQKWSAGHEVFAAGIRTDAQLRPLRRSGQALSDAVFAAGDILAGHDPSLDDTGMGVAIFTGYLAGERAANILARSSTL